MCVSVRLTEIESMRGGISKYNCFSADADTATSSSSSSDGDLSLHSLTQSYCTQIFPPKNETFYIFVWIINET